MPKQHRHLANKCKDIVNLQGAEAYCVAMRTACYNQICRQCGLVLDRFCTGSIVRWYTALYSLL